MSGTGILTRYPSTTHFCLALGPDSPSADEPGGGTLRVSGCRILTYICATQADILTSAQSTPACRYCFTPLRNAPLPIHDFEIIYSTASVDCLAPFIFGAGALDQ